MSGKYLCILGFLALTAVGFAQIPRQERTGTFVLEWRRTSSEADYHKATGSFEYATHLDHERTLNDWDLCLQGAGTERQAYSLVVRTVTDDRSDFWDVGKIPFEKVNKKSIRMRGVRVPSYDGTAFGAGLPPKIGHTYVVRTLDSDSDFWAKFTVTAIIPKKSVTIRWQLMSTPQRALDTMRAERQRELEKRRREKKREADRRKRRRRGRRA